MQEVCLVIPCYNESLRLPKDAIIDFYNQQPHISFCFVNDGSKDATVALLKQIQHGREDRIYILDLTSNVGKAEAVRRGILESMQWKSFDRVGYLDADLATPLDEMLILKEVMEKMKECEIIFGSRVKLLGRQIERTAMRHYSGRFFSTFTSLILNLPIYDTQCGAKIIKSELAKRIFQDKFISPWLFDVEIFSRIRNLYGVEKSRKVMVEFPLYRWEEKGDSKIKFTHLLKVPVELIRIHWKYR